MSPPMSRLCLLLILLAVSGTLCAAEPTANFEKEIRALLVKYCQKCHSGEKPKGEFNLTRFKTEASIRKARSAWRKVFTVVKEDEMPPNDPLPTPAERQKIVEWVESATKIDWSKVKNPGHVTIPRLTRGEYNNTMRDLLGVDLRPGEAGPGALPAMPPPPPAPMLGMVMPSMSMGPTPGGAGNRRRVSFAPSTTGGGLPDTPAYGGGVPDTPFGAVSHISGFGGGGLATPWSSLR